MASSSWLTAGVDRVIHRQFEAPCPPPPPPPPQHYVPPPPPQQYVYLPCATPTRRARQCITHVYEIPIRPRNPPKKQTLNVDAIYDDETTTTETAEADDDYDSDDSDDTEEYADVDMMTTPVAPPPAMTPSAPPMDEVVKQEEL